VPDSTYWDGGNTLAGIALGDIGRTRSFGVRNPSVPSMMPLIREPRPYVAGHGKEERE